MTRTEQEQLRALALAWDKNEPGAGAALYDLMEELGWPWEYRELSPTYYRMFFPGFHSMSEYVGELRISESKHWTYTYSVFSVTQGVLPGLPFEKEPPIEERHSQSLEECKVKLEAFFHHYLREVAP